MPESSPESAKFGIKYLVNGTYKEEFKSAFIGFWSVTFDMMCDVLHSDVRTVEITLSCGRPLVLLQCSSMQKLVHS